MNPTLISIIKSFLLPPGLLIIVAVVIAIVFRKSKSTIIINFIIILVILYFLSIPIVARNLAGLIEPSEALQMSQVNNAQAIVVLGCDIYFNAPEYDGRDAVSACTLVRLLYAAEVYEKTELPVMTVGGSVFENSEPEAEVMSRLLENRFGIKTTWEESSSKNTYYNAKNAAEILRTENINTILLVTHAIHMRRSKYSFEKNNIEVISAPTYFTSRSDNKPWFLDIFPTISALNISRNALHESIAYVWHVVKEN